MTEHHYNAMGLSIVLIGSPISGFKAVGPFKTLDEAEDYAGNVEDNEAWALLLDAPDYPWLPQTLPVEDTRGFMMPAEMLAEARVQLNELYDGRVVHDAHIRRYALIEAERRGQAHISRARSLRPSGTS